MFFNFSSAFSTIHPCLLRDKLLAMIMDYLTGRPQYVRVDGCASDVKLDQHTSRSCTSAFPLHTLYFHFNSQLDWSHSTDVLFRKGQSRLFFLRRLRRSTGACGTHWRTYQSVVAASRLVRPADSGGQAGTRQPGLTKSKSSWITLSPSLWWAVADWQLIQPPDHPTKVQDEASHLYPLWSL